MQVVAAAAMEPPPARDATDAQGRARRACTARCPRPTRPTTCAGSTRATGRSTASPRIRRPRRTPRCGSRSTTGAGPAFRSSSAPGKCLPATQTELRLDLPAAHRDWASPSGRASPSRVSWSSSSIRRPASGCCSTPSATRRSNRSRSRSTWSSPSEGGEGPTPYEVLLHAAMIGDSKRFTRQDGVEECWRVMAPLLEHPAAGAPVRQGVVGAGGGRTAARRRRPLARAVGGVVSTTAKPNAQPASPTTGPSRPPRPTVSRRRCRRAPRRRRRFRRSPNYAFLSNCHTGALVAPDGTIDWLCVPRFDSPSVFGTLLDRGAGCFRLGPFGINVPSNRIYEPGTNTLVTSWKTPTGWAIVRDALTMGPRRGEDTVTPHTRPPADEDAEHMLVRTVECIEGSVEIELVCEPVFDYGRVTARVVAERRSASCGRVRGRTGDHAADRHADRDRGRTRPGAARAAGRRAALLRALVGRDVAPAPANVDEANAQLGATTRFWRSLAGACADPRPRAGAADPALGARDQGAHVHADGGDRRGADDIAAGDPGRGAQLGLPLHVDSRLDVHAAGAALPRTSTGRPTSSSSSSPTSSATMTGLCRSCTGSTVAAI